ncbi:MAG: hypothetical protein RML95_12900 [Anaerolineae bacterium]|nr:hypothetical protein [Anaerolineae bacterium]MDW8300224.1 hypothetical protein [Anaerolineae bacterium]
MIDYQHIQEVLRRNLNRYGVYDENGGFSAPISDELYEALMQLPERERIEYLQYYGEVIERRTRLRMKRRETQIALKE